MGLLRLLSAALLVVATVSSFSIDKKDDDGELWAVLVAGSSTWYNYRHQVSCKYLSYYV